MQLCIKLGTDKGGGVKSVKLPECCTVNGYTVICLEFYFEVNLWK